MQELRPSEVVIELLKDGKLYDTVTLNEKNNWRHTWRGLPEYSADGSKIAIEEYVETGFDSLTKTFEDLADAYMDLIDGK